MQYDGDQGMGGMGGMNIDPNDIFQMFFGGGMGGMGGMGSRGFSQAGKNGQSFTFRFGWFIILYMHLVVIFIKSAEYLNNMLNPNIKYGKIEDNLE